MNAASPATERESLKRCDRGDLLDLSTGVKWAGRERFIINSVVAIGH
jgi:hypothetical protein